MSGFAGGVTENKGMLAWGAESWPKEGHGTILSD